MSEILLSICIPTYNRSKFIAKQLELILPITEKFKIPIFISDNSDNAETKNVIKSISSNLITYSQNEHNIIDRNFLKVIQLPSSKYRWLLSDSNYFTEDLLITILEKCEKNVFDYIFLNSGRVTDIDDGKVYDDPDNLLKDLGWHLTHISSIIYSEAVLKYVNAIDRYLNTNFIHHSLIFEPLANNKLKAIYIGTPIYLNTNLTKKNSWSSLVFEVWVKRWVDYIFSLPHSYNLSTKLYCIRRHNKNLFGFKQLINYYGNCLIDRSQYQIYHTYIDISLQRSSILFLKFLLSIPQGLFHRIYITFHKSI